MRPALKLTDDLSLGVALPIEMGGHEMLLDPAGVAFLPALGKLLVADLHLEKGSSFARRCNFLPPYDTMATLNRLAQLVSKYQPSQIITLGDNFHDDEASGRLSEEATAQIAAMAMGRELIWITGNHDPSPPQGLPGSAVHEMTVSNIVLRHIASKGETGTEFSGHLHPCAKISVRGKSVRRPCFATDGTRMIFPSFGVYTGGLNVRHKAFAGLFKKDRLCAYMMGTNQIYPIAHSALV